MSSVKAPHDTQICEMAASSVKNIQVQPTSHGDDDNEKVNFPLLLHDAVCDPSTDDCIHWLPGDNLFLISNKKKFAKKVLPTFPGNGVYTSFTRRLKRWGFERIASGPQIGAYKNEHFVRGNKELAKNMKYMVPKPMSMAMMHKNIAKLQAAKELTSSMTAGANTLSEGLLSSQNGAANVSMSPGLRIGLLQSMAAHQQLSRGLLMHEQKPSPSMEALKCRVLNGGNNTFQNTGSNGPSLAVQLALLQSLQNQQQVQQQQQAMIANSNTSFAEMLVRAIPQLAAQLLQSRETQPCITPSNSDLMMLLGRRS